MVLCSTGPISLGGEVEGRSVNLELDRGSTDCIEMDEVDVRELAERFSGSISMEDFYGKSSFGFGSFCCGGFYMGTICAAGQCYALLVAPNAEGCNQLDWQTSPGLNATPNACSFVDGFANTYNGLNNASHPAGNWTATRTINGFSDWYLPARDELTQIYENKDRLADGEQFDSSAYWSSTERDFGLAWAVSFDTGGNPSPTKYTFGTIRLRAIRREPVDIFDD